MGRKETPVRYVMISPEEAVRSFIFRTRSIPEEYMLIRQTIHGNQHEKERLGMSYNPTPLLWQSTEKKEKVC